MSCLAAFISAVLSIITEPTQIIALPLDTFYLPPYFSVDDNYDTPSKEECPNSRKSWIYTFISFIEALYRKECIRNGQIPVSSYVQFSEKYFLTAFKKYCSKATNSRFCSFKQTSNGTDGSISMIPEIIRNSEEIRNGVVPSSVCPNSCDSDECSSYPQQNKNVKYEFTVDDWAQSSLEIKELLYKKQKPLMFQMPEPLRQVYTFCETEYCMNKSILCPDYLFDDSNSSTWYCSVETSKTYTGSGEFFVPDYLEAGDPINFLIVGYSDSFIPSNGKASVDYMKYSKGGFIAKFSHSKHVGNTINYYLGKQSKEENFAMCPNYRAPQHWIGIDADDYNEKLYGDSTNLQCIDGALCDTDKTYFIGKQLTETDDLYLVQQQLDKVYAYMIGSSQQEYEIYTNKLFENLDEVFLPKQRNDNNVNDACGYWFIPYELVDRMARLSRDIRSRTIAISASVSFEKPSSTLKSLISSNTKTVPQRPETIII